MVDVGMLVCTQGMYNNKKSNFAGQRFSMGLKTRWQFLAILVLLQNSVR